MSGVVGPVGEALAGDRDGAVVVAGVVGGLGGVVVLEGRLRGARRPDAPPTTSTVVPGSAATAERRVPTSTSTHRPRRRVELLVADGERRAAARGRGRAPRAGRAAPVLVSSWDSMSSSPAAAAVQALTPNRWRPARGAAGARSARRSRSARARRSVSARGHTPRRAGLYAPAQLGAAPGGHRARRARLGQLHAARGGELQQLLALLALAARRARTATRTARA